MHMKPIAVMLTTIYKSIVARWWSTDGKAPQPSSTVERPWLHCRRRHATEMRHLNDNAVIVTPPGNHERVTSLPFKRQESARGHFCRVL